MAASQSVNPTNNFLWLNQNTDHQFQIIDCIMTLKLQ